MQCRRFLSPVVVCVACKAALPQGLPAPSVVDLFPNSSDQSWSPTHTGNTAGATVNRLSRIWACQVWIRQDFKRESRRRIYFNAVVNLTIFWSSNFLPTNYWSVKHEAHVKLWETNDSIFFEIYFHVLIYPIMALFLCFIELTAS